ncbi:MerR family transcriptional regulator [Bacillus swezeyi]|uniref:MerR family transcriptional regulator n=1 Tax=Bacillus swezeyi TaxID=1925020 RepID=A0A5M8RNM4_9BACI|nr:MerR family transcriptional regulator [Bacillus swezeyi]TYS33699.1 MerR family transcriptional regulator [Bacillus swezeyi]
MAEGTKVTKRTIDYYTKLGLLNAERSSSNYRFYDHSSIKRIECIENRQKAELTLDEIKNELTEKYSEEIDLLELRLKMNELNRDVSAFLTSLEKAGVKRGEEIKKKISQESFSLIQKLLLLFT